MVVQEQPEDVEYFNYFGSLLTNDARCTQEIKCRIVTVKATFSKKKTFHHQIGLTFEEETSEILYLERSSLWC